MTSGVYVIHCSANNRFYIGESLAIEQRIRNEHFKALAKGTHDNPHLQRSWNKYGPESFSFEIIWALPADCETILDDTQKGSITRRMEATIGYAMIQERFQLFNIRDFSHWCDVSPMLTPSIREKAAAAIRSKESRLKSSVSAVNARNDPIKKANILAATHSESARKKRSDSVKADWQVQREKRMAYWSNEENRASQSKRMKRILSDPLVREKVEASTLERQRKVICLDTNVVFPSLLSAAHSVGVVSQSILSAIKRKGRCGGKRWAYYNN